MRILKMPSQQGSGRLQTASPAKISQCLCNAGTKIPDSLASLAFGKVPKPLEMKLLLAIEAKRRGRNARGGSQLRVQRF